MTLEQWLGLPAAAAALFGMQASQLLIVDRLMLLLPNFAGFVGLS